VTVSIFRPCQHLQKRLASGHWPLLPLCSVRCLSDSRLCATRLGFFTYLYEFSTSWKFALRACIMVIPFMSIFAPHVWDTWRMFVFCANQGRLRDGATTAQSSLGLQTSTYVTVHSTVPFESKSGDWVAPRLLNSYMDIQSHYGNSIYIIL